MNALRVRDAWARARATVSPLDFARLVLGFRPGEEQARILREAVRFRNIGLNCSRQWGKSTVVTVLPVGPAARQAGETVRKVRGFLKILGTRARGGEGASGRGGVAEWVADYCVAGGIRRDCPQVIRRAEMFSRGRNSRPRKVFE